MVNYFNSYGSYLQGAYSLSSSNLLGYNSDYDPGLNTLFGYETLFGDANIKVNEAFRNQIDYNNGYITVNGQNLHLAELGNILYGFNSAKIGFTYEHAENAAYIQTYNLKYGIGDEESRIQQALDNELPDRILYKAGYALANNGKTSITQDDIFDILPLIREARELENSIKN